MAFQFGNTNNCQPPRGREFRQRRSKRVVNRKRVTRPGGIAAPALSSISFSQVNLGKRVAAMPTLAQRHSKDLFISLIQEPHVLGGKAKGKISGLDSQHQIHRAPLDECRAAIYAHKDIPIWANQDLSDKDVSTCLWVTRDSNLNRVLLVSCYWDRFLLSPPPKN